ncbi:exported hypothetical protein [Burkholderia diffusa]|nr:exported hypothetical protein [Burkholderia diffusa]
MNLNSAVVALMALTCVNLAFAKGYGGRQAGSIHALAEQHHVDRKSGARKKRVRPMWHEMVIARDRVTLLDVSGNPMRETTRGNRP